MIKAITLSNYKEFKCKCDKCRHTCCSNWIISLSTDDYFRLKKINTNDETIKNRISSSLEILDEFNPEKYGKIKFNSNNKCPLLSQNGFCDLQCHFGEMMLPEICIRYPRNHRFIKQHEVALTTSCEGVIEGLMKDDIITISNSDLEDKYIRNIPQAFLRADNDEIRYGIIKLIGDSHNIDSLFFEISKYLSFFDHEIYQSKFDDLYFERINKIYRYLSNHNKELFSKELFNSNDTITKSIFINAQFEIHFMKNILINHFFYETFPFIYGLSFKEAFDSMRITVGLIMYLFYTNDNQEELVDSLSILFRFIEHSNFYQEINKFNRN